MKPNQQKVIIAMRERGERITVAKRNIVEIFMESAHPLSVGDLLVTFRAKKLPLNKTTIYRQIDDLVVHGVLQEVQLADRAKRYELSDRDHHHHLFCVGCGKVADIELPENFLGVEKKILKNKKFKVLKHSLEFQGLCVKCK